MGIWDSFRRFSTGWGSKRHRRWTGKQGNSKKKSSIRDLRVEQFEDRVLLSISPAGPDADPVWNHMLQQSIGRAANLGNYTANDLDATQRWVVGLADGYSSGDLAAAVGADAQGEAGYLNNAFVWEFSTDDSWSDSVTAMAASEGIEYFYPLVPHERVLKYVPNDTMFDQQWHLQNTGQTGGLAGADANVVSAWDIIGPGGEPIRGDGIIIGIVDDGLDYTHPDLGAQYRADLSWDFYDADPDPMPTPMAGHGTSVAGVAGAMGDNALGVAGAALEAELAGLRLTAGPFTDDFMEAAALSYTLSDPTLDDVDIFNNSWGAPDPNLFFPWLELGPIGPVAESALQFGTASGRGGLGSIYTWAGGNGAEYGDNVNFDAYANSRFTIAVAAIDHNGMRAPYSEPGAPLLISAYSDNYSEFGAQPGFPGYVGITTTDPVGANGADPTDYTSSFGGTSAATPLVSGVIALMLEANPSLTARDVQHILVETAELNDPSNPDWTYNAAGYHINHNYGFGAIDAQAAVDAALNWNSVGAEQSAISTLDNVGTTIPDGDPTGITRTFNMPASFEGVEYVEVLFDADHTYTGDLEVILTSPSGTQSVLAWAGTSLSENYDNWKFTSARNWGESPAGEWSLTVRDLVPGDTGTWNSWQLAVYGSGAAVGNIPPELVSIFPAEDELIYNAETNRPQDVGGEDLILLSDAFTEHVAPRELMFRFAEGQQMLATMTDPDDPARTIDVLRTGIQIVRSGGDDSFGEDNDVLVEYGWIGIGEHENEVIARFAETLPDDLYRIYLIGDPDDPNLPDVLAQAEAPLQNRSGMPFHDGENLDPIQFDLDLGARVTAVVPQPTSRDQIVTAPAGQDLLDGDAFTVSGAASQVTFELNMGFLLRLPLDAGDVIDDGQTFLIDDGMNGVNSVVRFEFDKGDGVIGPDSDVMISIAPTDTAADVAQLVRDAVVSSGPAGVTPHLLGSTVSLEGAVDVTVSSGLQDLNVLDGDRPGVVTPGNVEISYLYSDTPEQIAAAVEAAIDAAPQLGLDVTRTNEVLTLSGLWADFDQHVVAVTVVPGNQLVDERRFIIGDDTRTLTFELDVDTDPGVDGENVPVPFTRDDSAYEVGRAIADAIEAAGLHLKVTVTGNTIRIHGDQVVFDYIPARVPFTTQTLFDVAEGALHQYRDKIEVYFNDDVLTDQGTLDPRYFQLIATNDSADTNDDTIYLPDEVVYDSSTNKALLSFSSDLDDLRTDPTADVSEAFRLRIGDVYRPTDTSTDLLPLTLVNVDGVWMTMAVDAGSSFETALDGGWVLGTDLGGNRWGSESIVLRGGTIAPDAWDSIYTLEWPGGTDEPGHRIMPDASTRWFEDYFVQNGFVNDVIPGTTTIEYNFRDDYAGDHSHNVITPMQKRRIREGLEVLSSYIGVQFVETFPEAGVPTESITIATGELLPIDGSYGLVAGVAGNSVDGAGLPILVAMLSNDAFEEPVDEYGGNFFATAMHEVLSALGLGNAYDTPPLTVMGAGQEELPLGQHTAEPVFPGDIDIVSGRHLYRPDSNDIDLYQFSIEKPGVFNAETLAERLDDISLRDDISQRNTSLLDSVLTLYDGDRNLIAQNDDYYSEDSYLEVRLEPGTYYIAVTSTGNDAFDPTIEHTGVGGTTQGDYELRLTFTPDNDDSLVDDTGTPLDGDLDGVPGGNYNFWFNVQSEGNTHFVDKVADPATADGTIEHPYTNLTDAFNAAQPGDIVRMLGNAGADGDLNARVDNVAYEIGRNLLNQNLDDGWRMEIPQGVTVMIDSGAVVKLRGANIDAGSSSHNIDRSLSHLQVLGTPFESVYFTSYFNTMLGLDTEPLDPTPVEGDWGGLVFHNDIDFEEGRLVLETEGIFLNYVNHADISGGGGEVNVNSIRRTYDPIHLEASRPTISYNNIHDNADTAISADPNSFLDNKFQNYFYTADYQRVGPDIDGNRLLGNSINGLTIRVDTPSGGEAEKIEVAARWDDNDIVHVVSKNVVVAGTPGGAVLDVGTSPLQMPAVQQLQAVDGLHLTDGDYFTITTTDAAGAQTAVTFEFNSVGGVLFGRQAIPYIPSADPGEGSAPDIAAQIAQAINSLRPALLMTDDAGNVREIDLATGRVTTTHNPGVANVDGGAAFVNGEIYLSTYSSPATELLVYDRGGRPIRTITLPYDVLALGGDSLPNATGNRLFAVPDDGTDSIVELDPLSGAEVSRFPAPAPAGGIAADGLAFDDNSLFFINGDNTLYELDSYTGTVVNSTALPAGTYSGLAAVDGHIYITDTANDTILELDPATGTVTGTIDFGAINPGIQLGTSLAGLSGLLAAGDQIAVTATAVGSLVNLVTDAGMELHIDGVTARQSREDARLVIDPGVIVKLNASRLEAEIGTQLIAEGEKDQLVTFTSLLDDHYGIGGTFDTKEISQPIGPTPGDWGGIYYAPVSGGSIDRAYLAFGGGATDVDGRDFNFSPVEIHQAKVRVVHSMFEQNTGDQDPGNRAGHGPVSPATIFVRGAQPIISGNIIRDNPSPALSVNVNALNSDYVIDWGRTTGMTDRIEGYADNHGPLVRDNLMDDNLVNGMVVRRGELTTQGIWDDTDIAHVVYGEILVTNHHTFSGLRLQSSGSESLVVKLEGPTAGFSATGEGGDISDRLGGSLQIVGTPGHPVVLTSLSDDTVATGFTTERLPLYDTNNDGRVSQPAPGDWRSVRLDAYTNDRNVQVYDELEPSDGLKTDRNSDPSQNAEWLGELSDREQNGDDNLRLGFEVHGFIRLDDPTDMDVYSFKAEPGTEVWIDLDRTMHRLDTIVELIDANGVVLASSDNSFAEQVNYYYAQFPHRDDGLPLLDANIGGIAFPQTMDRDSWLSKDSYTTNPRDAGFRVVLPGPTTADPRVYYVRVRSVPHATSPTDVNGDNVDDGITRGAYQMQLRLRETQELPGSNLRHADISYAVNGIELFGLPTHSPLLGETGEAGDLFGQAALNLVGDDNDLLIRSVNPGTQYINVEIVFQDTGLVTGDMAQATFDGVTLTVEIDAGSTTGLALEAAIEAVIDPVVGQVFAVVPDVVYDTIYNDLTGTVTAQGLVGTTTVLVQDNNNTIGSAQYIGNLLESDRDTLLVGGMLESPGDVDWYSFTVDHEDIQDIPGYTPTNSFWSTMFDVDFADGLERPDLTIWVFDSNGTLVYQARDSQNVDDQPGVGQGHDMDDLLRGSVGPNDPLLGNTFLREGNDLTYYVAVANLGGANALGQNQGRLEPIRSVRRIAEEHIDSPHPDDVFNPLRPHPTAGMMGLPRSPQRLLPDTRMTEGVELSVHVDDFNLGDVPLYVIGGTIPDPAFQYDGLDLYMVDGFTGAFEVDVTGPPTLQTPEWYGDVFMRDDGHLYTLTRFGNDAQAGRLRELDTGNGTVIYDRDDEIVTYHELPADQIAPQNVGVQFSAMTMQPTAIDGPFGANLETMYAIGNRAPGNSVNHTRNLMFWMYPDGEAGQYPNLADDERLGTDIIPLAELLTSLSIITDRATDIEFPYANVPPPYGDIEDGMTIELTDRYPGMLGGPNSLTFEFDSGPDVRFLQVNDRPALARDGDTFMLDDGAVHNGVFGPTGTSGTIFELESGPVIMVGLPDVGFQGIRDGLTFTITEHDGDPNDAKPANSFTFEFEEQGAGGGVTGNNVAIRFTPGQDSLQLTQSIVNAINGAGWNYADPMAAFVVDQVGGQTVGRVSLLFEDSFVAGLGLDEWLTVEGQIGPNAGPMSHTVLVPFEETWPVEYFGEVLEAVTSEGNLQSLPNNIQVGNPTLTPGFTGLGVFPGYAHRGLPGGWAPFDPADPSTYWYQPQTHDRITFYGATDYAFESAPADVLIQPVGDNNDMSFWATLDGPYYNEIEVYFTNSVAGPGVSASFDATTTPRRLVVEIDPPNTTAQEVIDAINTAALQWLHIDTSILPAGTNVIHLDPIDPDVPEAIFDRGTSALQMRRLVQAVAGQQIADGQRFRVRDESGTWITFEFDEAGNPGAQHAGTTLVQYDVQQDSKGEIAQAIANRIIASPLNLTASADLVTALLSIDGLYVEFDPWETKMLDVGESYLLGVPGDQLVDGDTFTVNDGHQTVTFEFDDNAVDDGVAAGNVEVAFNQGDSSVVIAAAVANQIETAGVPFNAAVDVNETSTGNDGTGAVVFDLATPTNLPTMPVGVTWRGVTGVPFFVHHPGYNQTASETGINPGSHVAIPFDADDDITDMAEKIAAAINSGVAVNQNFLITAELYGTTVQLTDAATAVVDPDPNGPVYTEGDGLGGNITGMTYLEEVDPVTGASVFNVYVVCDKGGLYRIENMPSPIVWPDATEANYNFEPYPTDPNSDELDQYVRVRGRGPYLTYIGEVGGDGTGIEFSALTAGPRNVDRILIDEGDPTVIGDEIYQGRYAETLFATGSDSQLYAFDINANLEPIFLDGATSVVLEGVEYPTGLAFSNVDYNLWHTTYNRALVDANGNPQAHGIFPSDDGRGATPGWESFYFGLEHTRFGGGYYDTFHPGSQAYLDDSPRDPVVNPAASLLTYNVPGGTHGSLTTDSFSLKGYDPADEPTFYFSYFLQTEDIAANLDTARVYISADGADWTLLANVPRNQGDWRQMRIGLGAFVGEENLRLRFDFSTAGDRSVGNLALTGEYLQGVPSTALRDGDQFVVDGITFEFDMGYSVFLPNAAGAAIEDGETFTIVGPAGDEKTYEFDKGDQTIAADSDVIIRINDTLSAEQVANTVLTTISLDGVPGVTPALYRSRVHLEGATDVRGRYALGIVGNTAGLDTATLVLSNNDSFDLTPTKIALVANAPGAVPFNMQVQLVDRQATGDQAFANLLGTTLQIDIDPGATTVQTIIDAINAELAGLMTASVSNVDADVLPQAVIPVPLQYIDPRLNMEIHVPAQEVAQRIGVAMDQVFTGSRQVDAVDGSFFTDGMTFEVSDGTNTVEFEINTGLKLVVPAGVDPLVLEGETFTVENQAGTRVTFEFDADNSATASNVRIDVAGLSDGQIAAAVFDAVSTDPTLGFVLGDVQMVGALEVHLPAAVDVSVSGPLQAFQFAQGDPPGAIQNPNAVEVYVHATDVAGVVAQAVADAINLANSSPLWRLNVTSRATGPAVFLDGRLVHFDPGDTPLALNGSVDEVGHFTSVKVDQSMIHVIGHAVTNPGPLPWDNSLPGDDGGLLLNTRAQNNMGEGWYIDDLIIGFAERGEMVTNVTNDSGVGGSIGGIDVGAYQLEIRRGTEFLPGGTDWDTNDRFREGITLAVPRPTDIAHGDTFRISDGVDVVEFRFLDPDLPPVGDGVPIYFRSDEMARTSETDGLLANRIAAAINAATSYLDVTAVSIPTSNRVDLNGAAWVEGIDYHVFGQYINVEPFQTTFAESPVQLLDMVDAADPNAGNILRDVILAPGMTALGDAIYIGGNTALQQNLSSGIWADDVDTGIILTNGNVQFVEPQNNSDGASGLASGVGDLDLDNQFGVITTDTSSLEFAFETPTGELYFDFVFASEEYNEFANTIFNDAFAIFIDGVNYALVPDTTLPISINTINGGNPLGSDFPTPGVYYYVNNDPSDNGTYLDMIGYDGFTYDAYATSAPLVSMITAEVLGLDPNVPHTIKITISDVGDQILDSAVLLRGESFTAERPPQRINHIFTEQGDQNLTRDQGWTIVERNTISDSLEWGILFESTARDGDGADWAHPSSPVPLHEINTQSLVPGVMIQNNLVARNGAGGIYFSGDANLPGQPLGAVPFGRIVNNTIYGNTPGANGSAGVGIEVGDNASPTLLNNIVANLDVGIQVDVTSSTTEIGATIYQNLATAPVVWPTVPPGKNPLGEHALVLAPTDPLFVNAAQSNFYLAGSAQAIDNSVEALNERLAMKKVREPFGIKDSPILAPEYDLFGQVRIDDPTYSPPTGPGTGGNVFVDRGAIERGDRSAPTVGIIHPQDNDADGTDRDSELGDLFLVDAVVTHFTVLLTDNLDIADYTVVDSRNRLLEDKVVLLQDGMELQEGLHYIATYNATHNTIRLAPVAGIWTQGSTYTIILNGTEENGIQDIAQNPLAPNRPEPLPDDAWQRLDPDQEKFDAYTYFTVSFSGFDYGDAPDHIDTPQDLIDEGYPAELRYPSQRVYDGARHIVYPGYHLGADIDTEMDTLDTIDADGDMYDDGIVMSEPTLVPGDTVTMTVTVSAQSGLLPYNDGWLQAWFDIDHSGTFESSEKLINRNLADGTHDIDFTVPLTTLSGPLYARFRFSSDQALDAYGEAPDGEVEDYVFQVVDARKDYGDAPDPYPTRKIDLGASHRLGSEIYLGTAPDSEVNGQPDVDAMGDDNAFRDDEDGVNLDGIIFLQGQTIDVPVSITNNTGQQAYLNAWFDFDGNGIWSASEHVIAGLPVDANTTSVAVPVPANAPRLKTYARFRISTTEVLGPDGEALDGEVEDYVVYVAEKLQDFGDAPAPYPTLLAATGARHDILPGMSLGQNIDADFDGIPSNGATGDDLNAAINDEDGVVFVTGMIPGRETEITVHTENTAHAGGTGFFSGWVDFNGDGDWDDTGEQIFADEDVSAVGSQAHTLFFTVPIDAVVGDTYARFRYSTEQNLRVSGPAVDGEVEDYAVEVEQGSTISGMKFEDLDADGRQDSDEPGLAGVYVYLDVNGDGILNYTDDNNDGVFDIEDDTPLEPVQMTAEDDLSTPNTDETGYYEFTRLFADTYIVRELLPAGWAAAGWVQTYPDLENIVPDGVSTYFDGAEGWYEVAVPANMTIGDVDFGNFRKPQVSVLDVDPGLAEGNVGTTQVNVTFQVVGTFNAPFTVNYHTEDGTATDADHDYEPASGQVTFQPPAVPVPSFSALELTSNTSHDYDYFVSGPYVVWEGFDGIDWEIYLFDYEKFLELGEGASVADATIQLTDNARNDRFASVNGHSVVWAGNDGEDFEIFRFDYREFKKAGAGAVPQDYTAQLSDNDYDDKNPRASEEAVVWWGELQNDTEIFYYDLADAKDDSNYTARNISNNNTNDFEPRLSGKNVVWYGSDGNDQEIYFFDGTSTLQVTNNATNDSAAVIDGSNIAWQGKIGANTHIYFFDYQAYADLGDPTIAPSSRIVQVSSLPGNNVTPSISGYNVVWAANWDIYHANASVTPVQATQISADLGLRDENPRIVGDQVVWHRYDGTDWEVVYYNLDGKFPPNTVTANTNLDWYPQVSSELVAWRAKEGDDYEIRIAQPGPPTVTVTVPVTVIYGDYKVENDEYFNVILDLPDDITVPAEIADGTAVVGILNDDGALDYGDAPSNYPTLLADNGARHVTGGGWYLGASVDAEGNGHPGVNADGDDNLQSDDENGVVLTGALLPGATVSLDVTASRAGYLDAWIDYNLDGDWDDAGEQVFTSLLLGGGTTPLSIDVPVNAKQGLTYARFRFSQNGGLAPTGNAMTGEVEDYALQIGSSVTLQNRVVTVRGSGGPDVFEFHAGNNYSLKLNGAVYQYAATAVDSIVFDGAGGDDAAMLYGGDDDDDVRLWLDYGRFVGSGVQVDVSSVQSITATGGGGQDKVTFYDSAGDDAFTAGPNVGMMVGAGAVNQASDFEIVCAEAISGGYDTAEYSDSAGSDNYTGTELYAGLLGDGYEIHTLYFDHMKVVGSQGYDKARYFDSPHDDTVEAGPGYAVMYADNYRNEVVGFDRMDAYGTSGSGYDIANFTGWNGKDVFYGHPVESGLYSPTMEFFNRAKAFEEVNGTAVDGGYDLAQMWDSVDNDVFIAAPEYGQMVSGIGTPDEHTWFRAMNFSGVHAYSVTGGSDSARFFDSAGDDYFYGAPVEATMYNNTPGQNFLNRAKFFERVDAYASVGGNDTSYLVDSAFDDTFYADDDEASIWGDQYSNPFQSGFFRRAKNFERVEAYAGSGGVDRAYLNDSALNDYLQAEDNWAKLSNVSLNFAHLVTDFAEVTATSSNDGDVKSVQQGIDWLIANGMWTDE